MKTRTIKPQTIAELAPRGESFIREMKKCRKRKPDRWDEYFDGCLDPETMQLLSECNTSEDKCYLIEDILKFLPPEIQDRIWKNKYLLFFAVFWSEIKSAADITRERDRLHTQMSAMRSKSKKQATAKKKSEKNS